MIIKIHRRDDPYARIDNRALSDKRLSYRARGVLAYLLSKPPNWKIRSEEVVANGTEGRDAVRSAFKELASFGYAKLAATRAGKEWHIYEAPEAKDGFSGDGPCPEKANVGKTAHIVTKEKSTNERPEQAEAGIALRLMRIMHRRETLGFSEKEAKSFRKIAKKISDDELCMLERYYSRNWPPNRERNILRHDLYTFLNNVPGEVDRALQWCEKHPLRSKTVRYASNCSTEPAIEIPPDSPENTEKFIKLFEERFGRLPHGYSRVDGAVVFTNGETK